MAKSSQFDASPSMLGYIYQIRFGLFLSLKKLSTLTDPEKFNVSIEKLDDIAFDQEGAAEELLQTKFHSEPGNLTDRSPDIWKTIRVWVESSRDGVIELDNVILSLVTTQSLPEGSLAAFLSLGRHRDVAKAIELMSQICEETNESNLKGYQAFRQLSGAQREALVSSIYVIGKSDDLLKIRDRMKPIARQSVPAQAVDAFLDRLEGVWFNWCLSALSQTPTAVINLGKLQDLVDKFRPEYSQTNLPSEYSEAFPDVINLDDDARVFIQQLRLFDAPKKLIEQAIVNYYRAFEQRNKWSVDGLLNPGELNRFDRKLFEKWEEQQAFQELNGDIKTDEGKRRFSVNLYQHCQQNGIVPIRPEFMEDFLSKGSYHILSDGLKIGWHPDFSKLGNASNEDAA